MGTPGKMNLAVVLRPAEAARHAAQDVPGSLADLAGGPPDESGTKCYLCALILPSTTGESYVASIWHQVVIEVGAMNAEVWLEFNPATRLYYTAI